MRILLRPALLGLCLLLSGAAVQVSAQRPADAPPNLVLILTDDQGYADVGFNGCQDIPTPHIDSIAARGVRFTNGYVSFAVCGPSRAGLITGRYQDRFGASRNPTADPSVANNGVPRSEKNLAELLKPRGYATMAVGKWHLGTHPDLRPQVRGFDEFFGFLTGGHSYFPEQLTIENLEDVTEKWAWYRTKLLHNGQRVDIDDYLTDELSDAAVEFIDRKKDEPFFVYLAYNAPHTPMQATEKYLQRFAHIQNERRRTYAAMVSAVDDGVGRVLAKLAEHDLDRDTIVVFLSDNGGATNNAANNRPLRGFKSDPFEGGIRVPFAMRWIGQIPEGRDYDPPVIALDIAGTIVGQSGAAVSPDKPLDGVDLMPYLTGQADGVPHDQLFWMWYERGRQVIRVGDDKLIDDPQGKGGTMLFDLAKDRREARNLAGDRAARVEALRAEAEAWARQMVPPAYPGLDSWTFEK